MAMSSKPQTQRGSKQSSTSGTRTKHGTSAHNKDALRSDRSNTMSEKPAEKKDQFGSAHNKDAVKTSQRTRGQPGGKQDLAFRESGQDTAPVRGAANRRPGSRSKKSGTAKKKNAV